MNFTTKLVLRLLIWALVLSLSIGLAFYFLASDFYSKWFPEIVLLFVVSEALLIFWVEKLSHKVSDVGLVRVYMGVSLGKMMLAVILIALYAKLVAVEVKAFAVNFILLYLLFLVLESWAFIRFEKYQKEKRLKK